MLVTAVDRGSIKKCRLILGRGYICKTSFTCCSKQSKALIFVIFIAMTTTVFSTECRELKSVWRTILLKFTTWLLLRGKAAKQIEQDGVAYFSFTKRALVACSVSLFLGHIKQPSHDSPWPSVPETLIL